MNTNVEFGLCCINTTLRAKKPSVFVNRTCRLQTFKDKGLEYIKQLSINNLKDCSRLLDWNEANGITAYRLSSDMFPHLSNPEYTYNLDYARPYLWDIGARAFEYGHRLSAHPGQYNQIGALNEDVFKKTIVDLECHCNFFDIIEEHLDFEDNKAVICIHGGGTYGDKQKTIERWCNNFYRLPQSVRSRIAIENCEKCYSVSDCLSISERLNIPVIFDLHHYQCYNKLHPDEKVMELDEALCKVFKTWEKRRLKPYCHLSEQGTGKLGHHSDYISRLPDCFLKINTPFTLDIEAKAKEKAILKLMQQN